MSNVLDTLGVYFTDIIKGEQAYPSLFRATFDPSHRGGVKIAKIVIVPERGAQSLCPFEQLFRYIFAWESLPSRAVASTFATEGDVSAFLHLSCSRIWYVRLYCLIHR